MSSSIIWSRFLHLTERMIHVSQNDQIPSDWDKQAVKERIAFLEDRINILQKQIRPKRKGLKNAKKEMTRKIRKRKSSPIKKKAKRKRS